MVRLVHAELTKLTTTRLWWHLLLVATAITVLYAALDIAFSGTARTWTFPLDTPEGQQTLFAVGAGAAGPLAAVLGAVGMAGEFRHRTITTTWLAAPRRWRAVTAKLPVHALLGAGYGIACVLATIAVAVPWLRADGIQVSLVGNGIPATMAAVVAVGALHGMLGVALGALVRDQAVAVTSLLVYLFIVEPVVTGVRALGEFTAWLPGPARGALTQTSLSTQDFLAPWQGGLVLVGYALVLVVLALATTVRRDVA